MVDYIITIVNNEGAAPCGIHADAPAHSVVTDQVSFWPRQNEERALVASVYTFTRLSCDQAQTVLRL